MEESLGKLTDAEIIAGYRNAESKYAGPCISDAHILASCKISSSKYRRHMWYSADLNLFSVYNPFKGSNDMLGYYETFEEAENRANCLFGELFNKLEKEVTENEQFYLKRRLINEKLDKVSEKLKKIEQELNKLL